MKTINKKNHETNIRTREAKYCSIAEAKYCRMLWTIVYVWSTTDEKVRLIALRKKCFFLVRIFPYSDRIRRDTPERYSVSLRTQSECGKMQTRRNSVFGHFSHSIVQLKVHFSRKFMIMIFLYSWKKIYFGKSKLG